MELWFLVVALTDLAWSEPADLRPVPGSASVTEVNVTPLGQQRAGDLKLRIFKQLSASPTLRLELAEVLIFEMLHFITGVSHPSCPDFPLSSTAAVITMNQLHPRPVLSCKCLTQFITCLSLQGIWPATRPVPCALLAQPSYITTIMMEFI